MNRRHPDCGILSPTPRPTGQFNIIYGKLKPVMSKAWWFKLQYGDTHAGTGMNVSVLTSIGRGSGPMIVPKRFLPQIIEEMRAWDRKTPTPERERIPNWDRIKPWKEGEQIMTFKSPKETDADLPILIFYPWWGLGAKQQRVRPSDFDEFISFLEVILSNTQGHVMKDSELFELLVNSNPDGPTEEEAAAYQTLLDRDYTPKFIDRQIQKTKGERVITEPTQVSTKSFSAPRRNKGSIEINNGPFGDGE